MCKPNCYECKHRRDLIGDAHSMCVHPETCQYDDQIEALMDTIIKGSNLQAAQKLNIQGHPHGIKCGWFIWPANFDPVWLENCNGFEKNKYSKSNGR